MTNHLHEPNAPTATAAGGRGIGRGGWDERQVKSQFGLVLPLLDEAAGPLHRARSALTTRHSWRVEGGEG